MFYNKIGFHILLTISFPLHNLAQVLVNVATLPTDFSYEIRYASEVNFMEEQLYDCAVCLLQPEVAKALQDANDYFCELGYRIKIFDCYRPLDVQKKMWKKVPNAAYVANPFGEGSVHNRGAAVDITLETLEGEFLDMGSDYDFFGRAAHIDNTELSETVLKNRAVLQKGMRKFGFQTIRTEWWHFSYQKNYLFGILNEPLPCED